MSQPCNPKVSVVITTYNRARLLPRAVNSVLAQTFDDYEIIIVDDCSPDHTWDVVCKFNDPRIRSIRHERNMGVSAARNTGIANARGKYITFLDDDDELLPGSIMGRVNILNASPAEVGMCYGPIVVFDDSTGLSTSIDHRQWFIPEADILTRCLALESPSSALTITVRTDVAREIGGFDTRYTELEDMNFSCRVALHYRVAKFPKPVAVQHISHGYTQLTEEHTDLVGSVCRHIADFEDELSKRPKAYAAVLIRLAIRQMMVRQRVQALRTYWKAISIAGLGSRFALRPAPHLVKAFFWYATPLSGIRGTARKFRNRMKAIFR